MSPAGYGFSLVAVWVFVGILHFRVWRLERRSDPERIARVIERRMREIRREP